MSGFTRRALGKTGLMVSPLGIGGGNGISSEDVLYAFERGINYFFFSSDLHHFSYRQSVEALRKLCGRGSSVRDHVVLATVSYVNDPEKLPAVVFDQLAELGVDYIDVFHWGWITDTSNCSPLFKSSGQLKQGGALAQAMRAMQQQAQELNAELLKQGIARYVGASFHSRQAAQQWMKTLDVLMLRYNIAHTGVEEDVFTRLTGDKDQDPGIVVFNTGHEGHRFFHQPPRGYPANLYVPTVPDCYRFALSNPAVDVVLTGVTDREQIDRALEAAEKGPLTSGELEFMREYGGIFRIEPHAA
jgi:aryl-alcohol dehydrogenase-like predicted oxidoreductase